MTVSEDHCHDVVQTHWLQQLFVEIYMYIYQWCVEHPHISHMRKKTHVYVSVCGNILLLLEEEEALI